MNITAIIIAYNESKNIRECIASVLRVCDEVIVTVDSKTTDDTALVAESEGARILHQEYLGDGPQKAFGVKYAKNEWILSIDADERLDEDAVRAIQSIDLDSPDTDAFSFRRKNFVGEHWVRAAGFYPDQVVRLYNRNRAGYLPKKSHSSVKAMRVIAFNAHLIHYTYENYTHWIERINALSSRDAWAMYDRGVKPSNLAPALHAVAAIIRKLVFKGGIFQGLDGATVAATTAFHAYMKYLKLNELYSKKTKENVNENS